ncbi:hypothetical protein D7319_07500 [Streptomyces radicis]|uniref:Type VII secretion system protein EccE domain-containing protein n=2 Tax=Streptomyces radicis TaxID=1750517 RepID=A0A3A9WFN0_9ACTN|nr:hypothetical protein D7319_07500 [Streptomyces radicis]RKN25423.1 hypothetical protein D7318_08355 [Streptomyces radicis]
MTATARVRAGTGAFGRFGRGRVVAVEAGLGSLAAGVAFGGPWGYALAGAGAATVAGALLRLRGRWAEQRLVARLSRDALAVAPVAAGPRDDGLGLVHALLPALDVTEVADRNGGPMGVISDGRGHAAVVEFPGGTLPALPAAEVARWLADDPARPAAAQVVVEQFGLPPWDLHYRYQPTATYRQLPFGGRPVAVRAWLVARYEPFDAPEAAERRGGGEAGARAAVLAATARLRARLAAAGAPTSALGADAVRELLRQLGDASGNGRPLSGSWAGDAAAHCTVTASVAGQNDWWRLLDGLSGCAADRVVTAATLTAATPTPTSAGGGPEAGLTVRTAVRVVSTLAQHAATERDRLLRANVVGPPAADQRAGLLATLPLAYPSRSLVAAAGFAPREDA